MTGLPVGVAGLGPAGASPCLEAPGGDSTDWQHSRHESLSTVGRILFLLKRCVNLHSNTSLLLSKQKLRAPPKINKKSNNVEYIGLLMDYIIFAHTEI